MTIPQILRRIFAFSSAIDKNAVPGTENYPGENNALVDLGVEEDHANLITSRLYGTDNLHAVTIDLDVPAVLIPSAQPGHSHLYIDTPISWNLYREILQALSAAGIIEAGYKNASLIRGYSSVRIPGVYIKTIPGLKPQETERIKAHAEAEWENWQYHQVLNELVNRKSHESISPLTQKLITSIYKYSQIDTESIADEISKRIEKISLDDATYLSDMLKQLAEMAETLDAPIAEPVLAGAVVDEDF